VESKGSILIIWIPVVFKGIALECFNSFSYTSNVSVTGISSLLPSVVIMEAFTG
jgi:hypothetical protein